MSASVQTVFLQFLWGICTFWATIHRTTQLGIPGARTRQESVSSSESLDRAPLQRRRDDKKVFGFVQTNVKRS